MERRILDNSSSRQLLKLPENGIEELFIKTNSDSCLLNEELQTDGLQGNNGISDSRYIQILNLATHPENNHFSLSEKSPARDPARLHIKTEPKDDFEFVMSPRAELVFGPPCGVDLTSELTKLEPAKYDSSSLLFEQRIRSLKSEMIFGDHSIKYSQDFLDIQQLISNQDQAGMKIDLFTLQTMPEGGQIAMDAEHQRVNSDKDDCDIEREHSEGLPENHVYSCLHCDESFQCLEVLGKHHLTHEKVQIINKCGQCRETFTDISILNNHLKMHILEKPNEVEHIWSHSAKKAYKCRHCGKTFDCKNDWIKHIRIHTGIKPYKCNTCGKSFNHTSSLVKHIRTHTERTPTHTEEKPHKCFHCGKVFSSLSHFKVHNCGHTAEKPYKCFHCGKAFRSKKYMKVHVKAHMSGKSYSCELCGNTFTKKSSLKSHMLLHSGEKPYKCVSCEKAFTRKSYLNKHIRYRCGRKPYKCTHCTKAFVSISDLNTHNLAHTGVKPYHCSHCAKTFSLKANLTRHLMLHVDQNPHSRPSNGYSDSNSVFNTDVSAHTRIKPGHCDQTFHLKTNLTRHTKIHENDDICSTQNAYCFPSNDLNTDMLIYSKEKKFKCRCGKAFSAKGNLTRHAKLHCAENPRRSSHNGDLHSLPKNDLPKNDLNRPVISISKGSSSNAI